MKKKKSLLDQISLINALLYSSNIQQTSCSNLVNLWSDYHMLSKFCQLFSLSFIPPHKSLFFWIIKENTSQKDHWGCVYFPLNCGQGTVFMKVRKAEFEVFWTTPSFRLSWADCTPAVIHSGVYLRKFFILEHMEVEKLSCGKKLRQFICEDLWK